MTARATLGRTKPHLVQEWPGMWRATMAHLATPGVISVGRGQTPRAAYDYALEGATKRFTPQRWVNGR